MTLGPIIRNISLNKETFSRTKSMKLDQFEVLIPEGRETEDGYVILCHGQKYTILLKNYSDRRCDAEVRVDGRRVGIWRVEAESRLRLERPAHDSGCFTFYEQNTPDAAAAGLGLATNDLGRISISFTPEISQALYTPAPAQSGDNRTLHSAPKRRAGGTGLSGLSSQSFTDADHIERDDRAKTTIHLRLAAEDNRPRRMFGGETAVPPPVNAERQTRKATRRIAVDGRADILGSNYMSETRASGRRKQLSFLEVLAIATMAGFIVFLFLVFTGIQISVTSNVGVALLRMTHRFPLAPEWSEIRFTGTLSR